jgi:hypothetical protein
LEFRQQTSFYSNSGLSFDINRYDVAKSAHLSNALIFGSHVTPVPKGYLYFAIKLLTSRSTEYENDKK